MFRKAFFKKFYVRKVSIKKLFNSFPFTTLDLKRSRFVMILNPFLLPIKILCRLGIWQDKNSSKLYKVLGVTLIIYLQVHGCFVQSVFAATKLQSNEFQELFETLSVLFTCYVTITKSLIFIASILKVLKLMKSLTKLLKFSNFMRGHQFFSNSNPNFFQELRIYN